MTFFPYLRWSLAGTVFAALAGPALAQGEATENVLVTGTRGLLGQRTDLLGASYSILSPGDLQNRQIQAVSDALRDVPGLAVTRNGTVGQFTQVRMRGGEANHTLVLIDGMEANDP